VVDSLLVSDTEAARLCGLSRRSWHRLRAAGKLPPAEKLGRAVRWRRADVEAWIAAGCPDARTWQAMQAAAGRRRPWMISVGSAREAPKQRGTDAE
jgi:excisionase family DNA binding protein